jgi:hypothetical protein
MQVSVRLLRCKRACTEQVEKFKELFGAQTIDVTVELCVKHAQDFDWDWAADNLLPETLRAEYYAKAAPLEAKYEAKRAPLWAEYDAKIAPLEAEYNAKVAPLEAEYNAKDVPLEAEYESKIAWLFGELAERI